MEQAYQGIFERYEKKYLLTAEQYTAVRTALDRIMEVDQYGETTILNIYYDTPDFRLIRRSLEGPVYKEKLRLRCYGVPEEGSPAFIELKKKYKGIVYKRRISAPYREAVEFLRKGDGPKSQIGSEIRYFKKLYRGLEPKMVISCERIAMAGKEDPELRVTFDRNIRWRETGLDLTAGSEGKTVMDDGQVLMEVKIKDAMSCGFARLFSELGIFPCSFSKYGKAYQQRLTEKRRLASA